MSLVLKKNTHFNKIICEGNKLVCKSFFIYYMPSHFFESDNSKIGISVGKKIGKAYFRNYQKRKLRSMVRNNIDSILLKKCFIVIIIRPVGLKLKYNDLEKDFIKIIKEINQNE